MRLAESNLPLSLLLKQYHLVISTLNSLFVLSLGLIAILLLDHLRERLGIGGHLLGLAVAAGLTVVSYLIHCEYCFLGIPLIIAFYEANLFKQSPYCHHSVIGAFVQILFSTAALCLYIMLRCLVQRIPLHSSLLLGLCQFGALLLIFLYNGTLGSQNKVVKYCFYIFYPAHILLLVILHTIFLA